MGDLLEEIKLKFPKAADTLKEAGLETDSDIQSLTRQDLNELLPGVGDFRLRKDVFEMIQESRPANMPQKELGELQNDLASSDQIDPGVSRDNIQPQTRQQNSKADKDLVKIEEPQKSPSQDMDSSSDLDGSQGVSKTSGHNSQKVKYTMVVAGQTFGAHKQLMDEVNHGPKGVKFLENSEDSQIIIVFCPITSRVESDVKAAMSGVPGDKRVILVKMHHVCESKSSLCLNTLIDYRNDVLQVNVFYHENFPGLLKCELNVTAVSEIQKELLKHMDHRSTETSASTSGQGFVDWAQNKFTSLTTWNIGCKDNKLVPK